MEIIITAILLVLSQVAFLYGLRQLTDEKRIKEEVENKIRLYNVK